MNSNITVTFILRAQDSFVACILSLSTRAKQEPINDKISADKLILHPKNEHYRSFL